MQHMLAQPNFILRLSESLTNVNVHISIPTWMVSRCDYIVVDLIRPDFAEYFESGCSHACTHRLR